MSIPGAAGGRITAGVGANLIGIHSTDRNQEATVYVGSIDPQASEELVWELFVQAGPVGAFIGVCCASACLGRVLRFFA